MTSIVLINGPPRMGKDFAGELIKDVVNSWLGRPPLANTFKFAEIVKLGTHRAYNIKVQDRCGEWDEALADHFEAQKDQPCQEFLGRIPRECYIAFSEAFMKPLHGPRIFGDLLLREYGSFMENCRAAIITDSGFVPEAEVLVEHFGAENCFLVRLHPPELYRPWWRKLFRKQVNPWAGDSRSWVYLDGVASIDVVNPMNPEGLRTALAPVLEWIQRTKTKS